MRRLTITLTAAMMLLVMAPSGALASRHDRRDDGARMERFGGEAKTAGTVRSFRGGVLTIMRRNGSTVRGRVNRTTELECLAPERMELMHDGDQSANDGPGDRADMNENEAAEPLENDVQRSCSTVNLRAGTVVQEAVLRISRSAHVWKKIELDL